MPINIVVVLLRPDTQLSQPPHVPPYRAVAVPPTPGHSRCRLEKMAGSASGWRISQPPLPLVSGQRINAGQSRDSFLPAPHIPGVVATVV